MLNNKRLAFHHDLQVKYKTV